MEMPRILVAEDEYIIAMDLCQTVSEAGFAVEGPHADAASAMIALKQNTPDLAILDVNLHDGEVFPLAEQLIEQDVPVIFHSGHFARQEMKARFPEAYACAKPCPPSDIIDTVQEALSTH